MLDLKNCPFCGATDSDDNACQEAGVICTEVPTAAGARGWQVVCRCGASSPKQLTAAEAIAAWNRRAPQAVGPEPVAGLSLSELQRAHIERQEEWCPDQKPDLSFRGNEMAGEVGEACNVIKKLERERHGWRGSRATKEQLAEELANVIHTAVLCSITAGIDIETATIAKFDATSEKNDLSSRIRSALVATPPAEPTPGQFAERVIAACRGYMNTYDVLAKEIRENMQFCMAEALRAADAVTNPVNTSTELTVLKADIDEFMRRLGPRWFLEQGWFPETVNATLATKPAVKDDETVVDAPYGWVYFNEDTGTEWSESHPVTSGEVPDATEIRPCGENEKPWIDELRMRDDQLFHLRPLVEAARTFLASPNIVKLTVNGKRMTPQEVAAALAAKDGRS